MHWQCSQTQAFAALTLAAMRGQGTISAMFLEAGADAEHRDASHRDVFERARMPDYHRPSSGLLPNFRFFSGQTATRTATRLERELLGSALTRRLCLLKTIPPAARPKGGF